MPLCRWTNMQVQDDLALQSFYIPDVVKARDALLSQEDTTGDLRITIEDEGPQAFFLRTVEGEENVCIMGFYHLSNLLQELTLAMGDGKKSTVLHGALIVEDPVRRIVRRINETFWLSLTRRMDGHSIKAVAHDPKVEESPPRIYVPCDAPEQHRYYTEYSLRNPEVQLDVLYLPRNYLEPQNLRQLRARPGILGLAVEEQGSEILPLQYIVPGGRFNELYGWDTYFISLGLLEAGRIDLVRSIVQHWTFELDHYSCILNSNRTYHLGRSQPPFLTDVVIRTYNAMHSSPEAKVFLRQGILTAIKEYHTVWMSPQRLDQGTGLSKYNPGGHGVPPEYEDGHFDWVFAPIARRRGLSLRQLYDGYVSGEIESQELDDFFVHDWAVRESGHDASYRVEGIAADLATVDLNCLLYKYEHDIAWMIKTVFADALDVPLQLQSSLIGHGSVGCSSYWSQRAKARKVAVDRCLWNTKDGMFHDYNTRCKK